MGARSKTTTMSHPVPARRRWLTRMTALASSAALPLWSPSTWAKSDSSFSSLPRTALVIGNGDYAKAPLRNPVNDANAIARALYKSGFELNLQINADSAQLADAIRQFTADLARNKGVGFFYYAGHGAQLASRNYLLPVDAAINSAADLQDKAIELNALLDGLSATRNSMNVIVLDACHRYPFSKQAQSGLSQYDAPPGSLLAYATSPGNTVADGNRENGLYTENLLRELAVPGTTIEDVFKRVRLAVHLQSAGRQVPWQSTSLDDDFYLQRHAEASQLSPAESARRYEEELTIWKHVEFSDNPASFEYYLRRFPSGKFSEIAQFQHERLLTKKTQGLLRAALTAAPIAMTSIPPNPYSKGTFRTDGKFSVGDRYAYRTVDAVSRASKAEFTETVTSITGLHVIFNDGERVIDSLGTDVKSPDSSVSLPAQFYPAEYAIGRKWTTRVRGSSVAHTLPDNLVEIGFKIKAKETITVPAGTFDTFKVVGTGLGPNGEQWKVHYWIAPEVSRRPLAIEFVVKDGGQTVVSNRHELTGFKQSVAPAPDGNRIRLQVTQGLALCNRTTSAGANYCSAAA
jgi:hypothetical protein